MELLVYEGNTNVEGLLDWIKTLDKYFNYGDVEEDQQVKYDVTRFNGHVTL